MSNPSEIQKITKELEITQKVDAFNQLLNLEPKKSWIEKHPFVPNVHYLSIGTVERLLRTIYPQSRVEIKEVKQLFNSVCTTVRVHYLDPVTNEWNYQDGVGAQSVQLDKGKNASDLSAIKSDAIIKAAPASASYAIKNACQKLGSLFGANLNREDVPEMGSLFNPETLAE
jgi:hypothetical protein